MAIWIIVFRIIWFRMGEKYNRSMSERDGTPIGIEHFIQIGICDIIKSIVYVCTEMTAQKHRGFEIAKTHSNIIQFSNKNGRHSTFQSCIFGISYIF